MPSDACLRPSPERVHLLARPVRFTRQNVRVAGREQVEVLEEGVFSLHAFVDESMRIPAHDRGTYILASVVCDPVGR